MGLKDDITKALTLIGTGHTDDRMEAQRLLGGVLLHWPEEMVVTGEHHGYLPLLLVADSASKTSTPSCDRCGSDNETHAVYGDGQSFWLCAGCDEPTQKEQDRCGRY